MKNKKLTLCTLLATTFAGAIAICAASGASFNLIGRAHAEAGGWKHYAGYDGGCTGYSIREYWTDCQGTTQLVAPEGVSLEERTVNAEGAAAIINTYGVSDSRVYIKGHDLHNSVCSECKEFAMTDSIFDTYSGHGTKGTATLVEDSTYSADGYGSMYKYSHTYNDGTSKFAISSIFNATSLEGISKVQFKIVVPEYRLLIAGDDSTNYEIYASANSSTSNPLSTILSFNRVDETDNWILTDSAGILRAYGGNVVSSASLSNRTTFNELFHNFTNWGVSNVYISDVMTNKHVCNFDASGACECGYSLVTSTAIASPSTLSVDTKYTAPALLGNVKMYKRSGYGSGLFGNKSLDGLSEIKFYVVNEDTGNGFALNTINGWTDYQGVIAGGSAPQVVVAKKSGSNWVVTTESGMNLGAAGTLVSTAGPSYTVSNPSTITDIMNTKSGSTTIYVSDIIAKSVQKEVITSQAIVTGEYNSKTYTLTENSTTVEGFKKTYTYSCSSYFRAMFTDIAIDSYKTIEFYYDASAANDQITFKYGESYFGFHKGAGDVTGYMKATNLGGGSWKLTTSGGLLMRLKDATKVSELSLTSCTKLNELFNVTADGWCNTPVIISDVLVTR